LLDIHVAAPTASNEHDPPLEVLEAGTGHGALTLHLARAVHAANPPPPSLPPPKLDQAPEATDTKDEIRAAWASYRTSRRAIVHSVEVSPTYSAHAQKLVHQFRRGMYVPHIDFHVANIGDWIHSQLNTRRHNSSVFRQSANAEPFLSYVILDMPGCHFQIETVAPAMKDGALLVVFVPSVTQIGDCVRIMRDKGLELQMEKVLELGEGVSNGRVWDVRLARKRAKPNDSGPTMRESQSVDETNTSGKGSGADASGATGSDTDSLQSAEVEVSRGDDSVMVCRPKVGRMTIGGGFIGLWRKVDATT
jgi:tRNA A58 N-methylase Trm61